MSGAYPSPEESLGRLRRSGWSMGEAGFTGSTAGPSTRSTAANGENRIRVEGATPAEASIGTREMTTPRWVRRRSSARPAGPQGLLKYYVSTDSMRVLFAAESRLFRQLPARR